MHPIEGFRSARGWTQEELARRTGVNLSTVRAWERGAMPSAANLRKLALLFEVDLIRLVDAMISWQPRGSVEAKRQGTWSGLNVHQ
jgi:transcriptional regulator with XRE-family HTH domain